MGAALMADAYPTVACERCGAERSFNAYCGATPECRWSAQQDSNQRLGRFRGQHADGRPRYPSWTEYRQGMPLVLSPELAKTMNALMMISGVGFDVAWDALLSLLPAERITG